ncbi:MAG: hypothetical protein AAFR98_03350 [Pseudomonadota bacterium]
MTLIHLLSALSASAAIAGPPIVENVAITRIGDDIRFDVTIRHGDTGWDHYADGWGVYDMDGNELGYRTLFHPHVNEQPFTRSLTITVSNDIETVVILPRDSVHGEGIPVGVTIP